jgi:GGDEF domain-containing protein
LLLDLDGFKPINDLHGHPTGDLVLKYVAQALRQVARNTDLLARMGGDEFTAILEGISGEENVLPLWEKEDADFFKTTDPIQHYITLQDRDFIQAVLQGRAPEITGKEGRKTVEIFTAIYRSMKENQVVKWPVGLQ